MTRSDILFISYLDTLELLSVDDALRVCEDVYHMQARNSIAWPTPSSIKLDVEQPFHNHWHLKCVLLKEIPSTGARLYNYYDDGVSNNVGSLERLGYVLLSDPKTGLPLAIIDDHWNYAIRSAAAPIVACKWLGPADPRVLGLIEIGTMGTNALRCLTRLYNFEEIRCTSRRIETREEFAAQWSAELGIPVNACNTLQEVASGADIIVGGTTSSDIMCREQWLKPGCLFISLARAELDPAGWACMDKVVVDSWDLNMRNPVFFGMVKDGHFSREKLHAEIEDVVTGRKSGRTHPDERILSTPAGSLRRTLR